MKKNLFTLILLCAIVACNKDDDKDMTYPVISDQGITANPIDCQEYTRGQSIPFVYLFTDDTELGSYNIEIHSNHDHHSHSTSDVECHDDHDETHDTDATPWVFNKDYAIPAGSTSYMAQLEIPIPADVATGDYHFMVRLTDRAGWQTLKAVAIRIE